MKFLSWLWSLLFGKQQQETAWVIVKIGDATWKLYDQDSIDAFFSHRDLNEVIDLLTIRRGTVGLAPEDVRFIQRPYPIDGKSEVVFYD